MASRTISVEIVGDASSLQRAFNKVEKSSDSLGRKVTAFGKVAGAGMIAVGVGAAFAGKKMIGLASDAAETESKLDVVFGKQLPGLKKNLDAFSDATGTSSFLLREQAADLGALLGPLVGTKKGAADMSEQFVKLATDLGSFNNVPTDEALLAIRSGLVGEAEPLRRFGVLLNEAAVKAEGLRLGLIKGKEELSEQEKVQARASLIMKQTTLAQGDATRTADSFANQLKRLKSNISDTATELGTALLPAANKVLSGLNDAAEGARKFFDRLKDAKGLEAKVKVVLDTGGALLSKVAAIAVDIGRQLQKSLGEVNWNNAGIRIAAGIGDALRRGLPVAGQLAATLSVAFINAVNSVDWFKVGGAIAAGIKGGAIQGIKNFAKNPKELAKVYSTVLLGVGVTKALTEAAERTGKSGGVGLSGGVAAGIREGAPLAKTAAGRLTTDAGQAALANAYGAGSRVGAQLAQGMAAGIAANLGYAAAQAEHMVIVAEQAARRAAQSKSPSKLMAKVGVDFGQGFIDGLKSTNAALSREMTTIMNRLTGISERRAAQDRAAAVREAEAALATARKKKEGVVAAEQALARAREDVVVAGLEKTLAREQAIYDKRQTLIQAKMDKLNAAVQRAQDKQAAIFDKIRDKILRAFDAIRGDIKTPAEAALAALNDSARQRDLQRALADAIASGDAEQILRAQEDIQRDSLERQAATERTALDQQTDQLRESLGEKLEVWKGGTAGILKLLEGYGIDFASVGGLLGDAFRNSLIAAIQGNKMTTGSVAVAGGGGGGGGGQRAMAAGVGMGQPIVMQVVMNSKVIAEAVRNENATYSANNYGNRPI